jgi:hypothetical protein
MDRGVPYIALGDSATQGMQSLGISWLSQHQSYPRLIADFLGASPFTQPIIKGWLPGLTPTPSDIEDDSPWFGNPPNGELILRHAWQRLAEKHSHRAPLSTAPQTPSQLAEIRAVFLEVLENYFQAVETRRPDDWRFEDPAPLAEGHYYQNLGVFGFTVDDVLHQNYKRLHAALATPSKATIAWRLGRFFSWLTSWHMHPSHFETLTAALLSFLGGDFGGHITAEGVGYVLGREEVTALEAAQAQHPRLVTLFIGASDIDSAIGGDHLFNNKGKPLYTEPADFRQQLTTLVEQILDFDSVPTLFLATIPDITATTNIFRNRLGHWKAILPSADFLTDSDVFHAQDIIQQYNQAIRDLAGQHDREHDRRIWLVDLYKLYEQMVRGTRHDMEAVRRELGSAIGQSKLGHIQAQSLLEEARASDADAIKKLLDNLQTDPSKALIDRNNQSLAADLNNFIIELGAGEQKRRYRITGDFIGTDPENPTRIVQGGAIGLDTLHLTNTANALVARAFLAKMYEADGATEGALLKGLSGQHKNVADFDAKVLEVAQEDTLLNNPPLLTDPVLDLLSALNDVMDYHHVRGTLK